MKRQHLLFIEIVGHAMRGVALAAKQAGHQVTGLDEKAAPGPGADWVTAQGIAWTRTPDPKLLEGIDLVIISGATPANYPLLREAQARHIPITSFAQYLGEMSKGKHVITVSGTHGKTTTTSFIAWLMDVTGRQPDFLIGIRPFNFESSARLEGSDLFVVEGDEYRASNLDPRSKVEFYHPDVMVLTSVEHDHPDIFPDLASIVERFTSVVQNLPETGRLVAWAESPTVLAVAAHAPCPVITYGLEAGDYTARNIAYQPTGIEFDIHYRGGFRGRIAVPLYGRHNVLNVLAAVAVARYEEVPYEDIIVAAASFQGAFRRFNLVTPPRSAITIVDDYAHHPTEVATTLQAARLHFPKRRIIAIFRPHTYSRTKALLHEYRQAFGAASETYITEVEAARENAADATISGNDIVKGLHTPAAYIANRDSLIAHLKLASRKGDVIVCMSVSGYANLAQELAVELQR